MTLKGSYSRYAIMTNRSTFLCVEQPDDNMLWVYEENNWEHCTFDNKDEADKILVNIESRMIEESGHTFYLHGEVLNNYKPEELDVKRIDIKFEIVECE